MNEITPILDRVVIRSLDKAEYKTKSGIFVVNDRDMDPKRFDLVLGEVVACGPGKINQETGEHIPMEIKPGDIVYYMRKYCEEVRYQNAGEEDVKIMREEDVWAVVEEDVGNLS